MIFNYNILKVKKNKLLLVSKYKLSITICIIKDDQEKFSILKKKFHIYKDQINKIIEKYYKRLL